MTDVKLYTLLESFANYWSVPISYVIEKITEWHPEVSEKRIETALQSDKLMLKRIISKSLPLWGRWPSEARSDEVPLYQ